MPGHISLKAGKLHKQICLNICQSLAWISVQFVPLYKSTSSPFLSKTLILNEYLGLPGGSVVKNLLANAGDAGLIPGLGWSPREGTGNPPQYSCLRNPMDRGAWWATIHQFSSVQSLSQVRFFVTPWTAAHQATLSITNSQSLLKLMSVESVMPSNHLILCHPFLLLPSIFPSIRGLSNESVLHIRWPKYWRFSQDMEATKYFQ